MTLSFTCDIRPTRVVFGIGSIERLGHELDRLGLSRLLLISTPGRRDLVEYVAQLLGGRVAGMFARAEEHVPLAVAEDARAYTGRIGALGCLAVGGGSAIGLAKAVALSSGCPIVAVPTTYSGSEMTPLWGITSGKEKQTGRDARVQPRCVVYDPALTTGLPPAISGASAMNAVAHCVEALYAPDSNPLTSLMAEEGIRALGASVPFIVRKPGDLGQRSGALYGAWLAGMALGSVSMGLHHRICHVLGGSFGLPHAQTHAVVLPHVARYNERAASAALQRVAVALGAEDAPGALFDLCRAAGAPRALEELGLRERDLDDAAALSSRGDQPNPRPVTRDGVREILEHAYRGHQPVVVESSIN